jgi:hypothetical protein
VANSSVAAAMMESRRSSAVMRGPREAPGEREKRVAGPEVAVVMEVT